ncbi:MAG: phytanoyl-CoA dioxygenase family protein [Burkholderiaceae bacterium]
MLSAAQIEQYHADGYVVPDFRMPVPVLEAIKARHAKLLAEHPEHPEFHDYCPALLDIDVGFLEFCRNDEILDMVAQVIGADVALWNSSFFAKPALNGKRTPWHQDGEYWPIRPLATCTVWLAIDDATPENGCLRVLRGSHKDRRLRSHHTSGDTDVTLTQELDAGEYDESSAVDLVLQAGQVSLHDVYLLHGSEANRSPRPRRGMTMRFMPTTSLFDRDLARRKSEQMKITDHSARSVFLMRGVDHAGNRFANA